MKQPERYVEPRLTQYLFDRASRTLTPLSGTFELSPVCNLACKMCYVRKTPAEVAASPRPPVGLIQWLSIAEQARDAGMLYLLLTGGEPFLWQDFWPLYERLSTMGFLISINSNGTLLDEARVARLAEHPPTRINITLYGAGNETYEALCGRSGMFDRVDRAITLLRQAGILVKLNCSLTPHNAGDLEGIVSYAAERDLILEVNTYMSPRCAATRPWSGGTTASPRRKRRTITWSATACSAARRTSPASCRTSCAASPRPPVWTRTASTP